MTMEAPLVCRQKYNAGAWLVDKQWTGPISFHVVLHRRHRQTISSGTGQFVEWRRASAVFQLWRVGGVTVSARRPKNRTTGPLAWCWAQPTERLRVLKVGLPAKPRGASEKRAFPGWLTVARGGIELARIVC